MVTEITIPHEFDDRHFQLAVPSARSLVKFLLRNSFPYTYDRTSCKIK